MKFYKNSLFLKAFVLQFSKFSINLYLNPFSWKGAWLLNNTKINQKVMPWLCSTIKLFKNQINHWKNIWKIKNFPYKIEFQKITLTNRIKALMFLLKKVCFLSLLFKIV